MGQMKIEDFKTSKTDRRIIYALIFIPLLILISNLIWGLFFDSKTSRDYFLESRANESFHGHLDSMYRQKNNHNILTFKGTSGLFEVEGEWENKFRVGDSISKSEGSLLVEHYRDGKLLEVLNYADLRKEEKSFFRK